MEGKEREGNTESERFAFPLYLKVDVTPLVSKLPFKIYKLSKNAIRS